MKVCWFERGSFFLAALVALSGCGSAGDICSAGAEDLAGTWEVAFDTDDGKADVATVTIDEDGNVSLDTDGNDDWQCSVVSGELCDLEVHCEETDGDSQFTLTVRRRD